MSREKSFSYSIKFYWSAESVRWRSKDAKENRKLSEMVGSCDRGFKRKRRGEPVIAS